MRKILYMMVLLFVSTVLCSHAQQKEIDRSMELHVGQELPDLPSFSLLNYGSQEIKLESLLNKVVILDFFDTTCYGCILALPKLQKLQDELGDKLQVVVVTWQDRETIDKFFSSNAYVQRHGVQLPVIYSDTLLRRYFPHTGVPHHVWLFKNRVQAVTYGDFANGGNVKKLYNDENIKLPLKNDFSEDAKPLLASEEKQAIGAVRLVRGFRESAEPKGLTVSYDSLALTGIARFNNVDALGAYTSVLAMLKRPSFLLKDERIIWKVNDRNKYHYAGGGNGKTFWLLEHGLSYERSESSMRGKEDMAQAVLQDLNNFLGLDVRWDVQEIPCLVLEKTGKKVVAKEEKIAAELGGTGVLAFMIDYQAKLPPVVDEVDSNALISLDNFDSLEIINQQLAPQGLVLKPAKRILEVLVFEEIDQ